MNIEIVDHFPEGRAVYYWTLHDGPDGIDKVTGYAVSLEEALNKILEWRQRIAHDYRESVGDEMGTGASGGFEYGDPGRGDDRDSESGS